MASGRRFPVRSLAVALFAMAALGSASARAAVTTYTGTFAGTIAAGDTALLTGTASVSGNVANSGTLQFNVSGSSAVANNAIISGTGVVRMTGSGTVSNLFDAQTYTGRTLLENGTLLINYNDRLGNTSSGVTFDGGRLQITNSGVVSTFSTARSMSLVSAGTIDTSTLADGSFDQPAFTGVVSGTGALTIAAHGLGNGASDAYLRFGGASTYTGTTRVTSGMVYASSTAAFGTSTVVLDGGGLVAPSAVTFNNALVLAGTANFLRPWTSQTMNLGGVISGTGGLQKTDNGTVNLNAANTYTGDTRILSGALNAANYSALAGTTLDMNSADAGSIGFTVSQTGTYQIGGLTGSRNLANGGNGFAIGANGASTTYSGTLSGGGALVKSGGGTLTLTASNSYTGGTALEGGALELGSAGAIGSFGTISFTGGTLRYSANNATDYSSRFSTAPGQQYSIDTANRNVAVSFGLTSAGGSLTKLGEGTLQLLSVLNSYSGTTTIASGTLQIKTGPFNSGRLGTGPVVNNGVLAFELYDLSTVSNTISGPGRVVKTYTGELELTGSNSYSGGTTLEDGSLLIGNNSALGSGTLALTSPSSTISLRGSLMYRDYTIWNPVTIGGDVALGKSAAFPSPVFAGPVDLGGGVRRLSVNSPSAAVTGTISNGGVTKTGNGTLYLLGGNSYAGATTVIRGGLALINAGDISASSGLALFATGQFSIAGADGNRSLAMLTGPSGIVTLGARTLTVGNSTSGTFAGNINGTGGLTKAGSGSLTLSGSNSFTGQTTVAAGTLILASGNALAPTAAVVVNSGATLQANQPIRIGYLDSAGTVVGGGNLSATLTVTRSGNIGGIANGSDSQGTFAAGIAKLGTGTSTVNASNTYTGLTWVREGTLAMGLSNAFTAASSLTVDSGATFDRAGFSQTVTDAAINGSVANAGGGGLLTVTGTLSGSGIVNGNVTVAGVHAPGNSPGLQTITGDLTYAVAAAVEWELIANSTSDAGTNYDQIAVPTGNLLFSGSTALDLSFDGAGSTVVWSDPFWDANRAWTIFDLGTGTTTGFESLVLGGSLLDSLGNALLASRGAFSLGQVGQDVVLNYTVAAVPEPATWAMALAGLAGMGCMLRRRRRTKA